MAEEITKYDGKVERFMIIKALTTSFKYKPKHVKVTSESIFVDGKDELYHGPNRGLTGNIDSFVCDWTLQIPLAKVKNVFYQSFKAEGVLNHHKDAVGVEAKVDGSLMNYAIFTKHPDALFRVIEDSRPAAKK